MGCGQLVWTVIDPKNASIGVSLLDPAKATVLGEGLGLILLVLGPPARDVERAGFVIEAR